MRRSERISEGFKVLQTVEVEGLAAGEAFRGKPEFSFKECKLMFEAAYDGSDDRRIWRKLIRIARCSKCAGGDDFATVVLDIAALVGET